MYAHERTHIHIRVHTLIQCTHTPARNHLHTHAYTLTHSHTQRVVELAAAVRVGVAMGALAGVNGLRVLSKTGAKVGERLLRRGQPAPVGGLDPVDWAYVVGRRANAMRMRTPARPQSLARSIECRSRSPSFPRAGERWRRLTCLSRRAEGGGAGGRDWGGRR